MFTATYPATFVRERDGKGFHVRFPDLPEALTGGDDLADTLEQAADCVAEAIAGRIRRGDPIPHPSPLKRGQHAISVPLSLAPKLALYMAMRDTHTTNTDLARGAQVSETVVRRMLDPKHNTKPERIQVALSQLGKRIVVTFEDAVSGNPYKIGVKVMGVQTVLRASVSEQSPTVRCSSYTFR